MNYIVQTQADGKWYPVARTRSLVTAFIFLRGWAAQSGSARILDESGDTVAMVTK